MCNRFQKRVHRRVAWSLMAVELKDLDRRRVWLPPSLDCTKIVV
jgi:hypothetical protein